MLITKHDIAIFHALNPETGAQWLPGHWLAKQLGRNYLNSLDDRLRELVDAGYLQRDKPNTKHSKHSSWSRTHKADEYMQKHFNEAPVTRSKVQFKHQVHDDMDTASIRFGVEADPRFKMRFGHTPDINFEFDGRNRPIELATRDHHIFRFKENDRNTEQAGATEKSTTRQTWTYKIRNIAQFHEEKTKHGFDRIFVSILSVSEAMGYYILDKVIPKEIGACKYIGVATWKDWGNHDLRMGGEMAYPQPDGFTFTVPYQRAGHEPMYLNRFWEC
jgi:hypothetical protein